MGEIADMMIDGTLCQACGVYIGTDNGFPTYCSACAKDMTDTTKTEKVPCKKCGRLIHPKGLSQHHRDKH